MTAVFVLGCSQTKDQFPPDTAMKSSSGKIVIYQMMTRLFGNKNTANKTFGTIDENGVGKFADINAKALRAIKELGVTHIWYTGVIEHAVLTDYTAYGIPLDDADVVKGRAGSPYAIKDYYDVDPDLATDVKNRMSEFEQLVKRTHDEGMKVIIDFVPNHVARAYHSDARPQGVSDFGQSDDTTTGFKPSNNFYYLPGKSFEVPNGYRPLGNNPFPTKDGKFDESPAKVTGNDQFTHQPGINEWFETVKLNYGVDIQNGRQKHFEPVPDTWLKMKDILLYWGSKQVDGFRCDMAEMVPVEFWSWVIPQVKETYPGILFIAEIYNPSEYSNYIRQGKFDFLYDKVQLYDTLRFLISGNSSTGDIARIQQSLLGIRDQMLHFLENHDEQRIASRFFAGDPWKALPAMVISATIDRGPVMIYFGQEVGEAGQGTEGFQGDDGRTTLFDYWGVPEHQKWMNGGEFDGALLSEEQKQLREFYIRLLNIAGSQPAITGGAYVDLTEANIRAGNFDERVATYIRYTDEEKLIIVASFHSTETTVTIKIPEQVASGIGIPAEESVPLTNLLANDAPVNLNKLSLELTLKPYSAHIFKLP
jgi:glycosidase